MSKTKKALSIILSVIGVYAISVIIEYAGVLLFSNITTNCASEITCVVISIVLALGTFVAIKKENRTAATAIVTSAFAYFTVLPIILILAYKIFATGAGFETANIVINILSFVIDMPAFALAMLSGESPAMSGETFIMYFIPIIPTISFVASGLLNKRPSAKIA